MNTNRLTFDRQLGTLRDQVLQMSEIVEQSILLSGRALNQHDIELAQQVCDIDAEISIKRFAIEENAYQLLALQQPNAKDMRQIVAGVSVVTNLERIGEHCSGIARLVIRMEKQSGMIIPAEFETMANVDQWLTRNAMTAFSTSDEDLAQKVIDHDSEIDEMHDQVYKRLIAAMTTDPTVIETGTLLLWVSHNFERIGDRSTNIARRVAYLVKGELIRNPEIIE